MKDFPINMFDLVAVGFLIFGITRGRKNGMSVELMFMLQWLLIVFGSVYSYPYVADWLFSMSPLSRVACNITAYLFMAILIRILFGLVRKGLGGKLVGSSIFGASEYYLGMLGGLIRFFCVMLFLLSFLHARQFTAKEVRERDAYQKKWFDSNFFPGQHDLQVTIFEQSIMGQRVLKPLEFLMIKPVVFEDRGLKRASEFQDPGSFR